MLFLTRLLGWHRRYAQRYWWLISGTPKHPRAGRPRIDPSVEQIILDIKAENPRYGAERIAALVTEQLGVPVSESTVRTSNARKTATVVLKNHLVGGGCSTTSLAIGCSPTVRTAWKSPEIRFRRIFAPYRCRTARRVTAGMATSFSVAKELRDTINVAIIVSRHLSAFCVAI